MTERHYTAWMTNDPSCVLNDVMDVTVIEDVAITYREKVVAGEYDPETGDITEEIVEVPEWASQGDQMFYAETDVDAEDGEAEDGLREAEDILDKAGWRITGDWEVTENAYCVTVEYTGPLTRVIEKTDDAENPQWYPVFEDGRAEEMDEDTVEEYGLAVLENYWADNEEEKPEFTDADGNPYYRVIVRTADGQGILATVESSAAAMTPAAFKVTREMLGLSDGWLASHLQVTSRTVRNWESGKYAIPTGVETELYTLAATTRQEVARIVNSLQGKPAPRLVTYRNDDDYKTAHPDSTFPASWHRAMTARAALEVPGARVIYSGNK